MCDQFDATAPARAGPAAGGARAAPAHPGAQHRRRAPSDRPLHLPQLARHHAQAAGPARLHAAGLLRGAERRARLRVARAAHQRADQPRRQPHRPVEPGRGAEAVGGGAGPGRGRRRLDGVRRRRVQPRRRCYDGLGLAAPCAALLERIRRNETRMPPGVLRQQHAADGDRAPVRRRPRGRARLAGARRDARRSPTHDGKTDFARAQGDAT